MSALYQVDLQGFCFWCRCLFEITVILPIILDLSGTDSGITIIRGPGVDCREWKYECSGGKVNEGFTAVWAVLAFAYGFNFYYWTYRTRVQLKAQSYLRYRAPNILLQLQVSYRRHVNTSLSK